MDGVEVKTGGQHTRIVQCLPRSLLAACPPLLSPTPAPSLECPAQEHSISLAERNEGGNRRKGKLSLLGAVSRKTQGPLHLPVWGSELAAPWRLNASQSEFSTATCGQWHPENMIVATPIKHSECRTGFSQWTGLDRPRFWYL